MQVPLLLSIIVASMNNVRLPHCLIVLVYICECWIIITAVSYCIPGSERSDNAWHPRPCLSLIFCCKQKPNESNVVEAAGAPWWLYSPWQPFVVYQSPVRQRWVGTEKQMQLFFLQHQRQERLSLQATDGTKRFKYVSILKVNSSVKRSRCTSGLTLNHTCTLTMNPLCLGDRTEIPTSIQAKRGKMERW